MRLFSKLLLAGMLSVATLSAYNPLDGVKAQKAAAMKVVKNHFISVKTLKNWLKNDKEFEIIDVREQNEFDAGHIDYIETLHVPRGILYAAVKKGALKPNKTYVVVCRTGHRALLATATLMKWYGFKNTYVLKGGIKAWIKAGGEIENSLHLGTVKIQLQK